jgi:hypothetical protein
MATIRLTPEFREFLSCLRWAKVDYLLIGGYAVALYGHIRPTKDLDLWISADADNIGRLAEALVRFGFSRETLAGQPLFAEGKTVLRLGVPPNRLEVLSSIAGVEFADCRQRRRVMWIDDQEVPVIDLDDLVRNKRAAGRASDLADVERLLAARTDPGDAQAPSR